MVEARPDVVASDSGQKRADLRDVCGAKVQGLVIKYGSEGERKSRKTSVFWLRVQRGHLWAGRVGAGTGLGNGDVFMWTCWRVCGISWGRGLI